MVYCPNCKKEVNVKWVRPIKNIKTGEISYDRSLLEKNYWVHFEQVLTHCLCSECERKFPLDELAAKWQS